MQLARLDQLPQLGLALVRVGVQVGLGSSVVVGCGGLAADAGKCDTEIIGNIDGIGSRARSA